MRKEYFEHPKKIRTENDVAGFKRAWFEVADGEAVILKFKAGTKDADIDAAAEVELQKLKARQTLEEQLAALEAEAEAIRQQLGNGQ